MSTKSRSKGVIIRQKVVPPEVQRRLAATPKPEESVFFNRLFARSELTILTDNELMKVIMKTTHQRIHVDALSVAKTRPTLADNATVRLHLERTLGRTKTPEASEEEEENRRQSILSEKAYRERQKKEREFARFTEPQLSGLPPMSYKWFSVWIGPWNGVVFGTRDTVVGQAYRKYGQEVPEVDTKATITVRELPSAVHLPN